MTLRDRREFLRAVGHGTLLAGIGTAAAVELGLCPAWADQDPPALDFGPREPLVRLLQDTPPEKLIAVVIGKLRSGTGLDDLVAAAALANARTFAGEDYIGFHTMMALVPARCMAAELPAAQAALPVLKVLHRNAQRITAVGGRATEKLRQVAASGPAPSSPTAVRDAIRRGDLQGAEDRLAAAVTESPERGFGQVLTAVEDGLEVHRVVMPHRAWELVNLVGREHAFTLLRQSVHYCAINDANPQYAERFAGLREKVASLMDRVPPEVASRQADDAWVDGLARQIISSSPAVAADLVAAALDEGFPAITIGEAVGLAAADLVLRDPGRSSQAASEGKPAGSVHGDSTSVHACDAINALRGMALVDGGRHAAACLVLAAWEVASDAGYRRGEFSVDLPYPHAAALTGLTATDPGVLLRSANEAIVAGEQALAAAAVERYGRLGGPPRPVFEMLLRYAVSEDGALHAEKFYRTVSEAFETARPALRWRHLVALARVTASEYGTPAPGIAEARSLLGLS